MNLKPLFTIVCLVVLSALTTVKAQNQIQLALAQGDYENVINRLSPNINTIPPTERYYLAVAYQQTGYPDKAINSLLMDSTQLNKQQESLLCRCFLTTGNYNKALPICVKQYINDPLNTINLLRYAEINSFYKEYDNNITILKKYVDTDSTNYNINVLLAESYEKAKEPDSAIATYKMILSQQPNNQKIALRLANLYYKQKLYVECHDLCVPFIHKLDNNKNFLLIAGLANFKNGSNHNVLVMYRTLEAQGDSSFITKKHLGIASYRLENFKNATNYLKSALKIKDTDPEVAFFLGASIGQSNTPLEGRIFLYLAQELIKPSPVLMEKINVKLAMIHFDTGHYKQAINNYHEAFKYDNKAQYLYRQASIYDYQLKNPEKAQEMYQLFLDVLPDDLDPKKGNELYAIKLKDVTSRRLASLKEDDFFKNGL